MKSNIIAGHVVPCVNSTVFPSEIGNILCKGQPFAAIWRMTPEGTYSYSLRSDKDDPNAMNVAEIAEKFGGGGHPPAAGFVASAPPMLVAEKKK